MQKKAGMSLEMYKQKYMNGEINSTGAYEFFLIHDRSMRKILVTDTSKRKITYAQISRGWT